MDSVESIGEVKQDNLPSFSSSSSGDLGPNATDWSPGYQDFVQNGVDSPVS